MSAMPTPFLDGGRRHVGPRGCDAVMTAMPTPFLEGKRLYLRRLTEADIQGRYLYWLNDAEVCRWNSHHVFPYSGEAALDFIRRSNNTRDELHLAIILREGDRHIGNIALQNINMINRSAEYAILIGERDTWGKGYAREATCLLFHHAFQTMNLHRIHCGTMADNEGMIRVAAALGMKEEGRRRQGVFKEGRYVDVIEYGLLAVEFQPTPAQGIQGEKASWVLDDLPKFSPWTQRVLGLVSWERPQRTAKENQREYEAEKWGPLLERVKACRKTVTLDEIEDWVFQNCKEVLASVGKSLVAMSGREAHGRFRDLVATITGKYWPATALIELGCGYGSIILGLAHRLPFKGGKILAAEYTPSGQELTSFLAGVEGVSMDVGACDFGSSEITDLHVPEGSILLTSYAAHYLPLLPDSFVTGLAALKPKVVIHCKPCYEHCESDTILGLMRKRYMELNDYNRNLVTLLRTHQERGTIRILEEQPAVFGANPLLPASIIVWEP